MEKDGARLTAEMFEPVRKPTKAMNATKPKKRRKGTVPTREAPPPPRLNIELKASETPPPAPPLVLSPSSPLTAPAREDPITISASLAAVQKSTSSIRHVEVQNSAILSKVRTKVMIADGQVVVEVSDPKTQTKITVPIEEFKSSKMSLS